MNFCKEKEDGPVVSFAIDPFPTILTISTDVAVLFAVLFKEIGR